MAGPKTRGSENKEGEYSKYKLHMAIRGAKSQITDKGTWRSSQKDVLACLTQWRGFLIFIVSFFFGQPGRPLWLCVWFWIRAQIRARAWTKHFAPGPWRETHIVVVSSPIKAGPISVHTRLCASASDNNARVPSRDCSASQCACALCGTASKLCKIDDKLASAARHFSLHARAHQGNHQFYSKLQIYCHCLFKDQFVADSLSR